jgi:hypothetical protein
MEYLSYASRGDGMGRAFGALWTTATAKAKANTEILASPE